MTIRLKAKLRGYIHGIMPTRVSDLENDVPFVSASSETEQSLTDAQKRQALSNLNAIGILGEHFVRYDIATTLNESNKKQARDNLDVYSKAEVDEFINDIEIDFLDDANKYADRKIDELAHSIDGEIKALSSTDENLQKEIDEIKQDIGNEEYQGFEDDGGQPSSVKGAINKLAARPKMPNVDEKTIVVDDTSTTKQLKAIGINADTTKGNKTITPQDFVDIEARCEELAEEVDRISRRGGYLTPFDFGWDGVSSSVQIGDTFEENRNGVRTEITVVDEQYANYPTGVYISLTDAQRKAVDWQIELIDWSTFDIWAANNKKYGDSSLNSIAENQRITISVKTTMIPTEPFCESIGTNAKGERFGVYRIGEEIRFGWFTYDSQQSIEEIHGEFLYNENTLPYRFDYLNDEQVTFWDKIERPFGGESGIDWEEDLIVWEKDFYDVFNGTRVINEFNDREMELTNTQDTTPPVYEWNVSRAETQIDYADDENGGIVKTGQTEGTAADRIYRVQLDEQKRMYVDKLGADFNEIRESVDKKITKLDTAEKDNIVLFGIDGEIIDSNKKITDFATSAQGKKAESAYQKPATGIPESDLATAVQEELAKANTAIQNIAAGSGIEIKESSQNSFIITSTVNPNDYVVKNQPIEDAGKVLGINEEGQVVAVELTNNTPNADFTVQINGVTAVVYNGETAKTLNITPNLIGSEPAFEKKTAFNKDFGTSEGTVARGNDERIVSAAAARTALGLGTAAYTAASEYATAQQGLLAESAIQELPEATNMQEGIVLLGAQGGAARFGNKSDVGLENVDNTADVDKPISTATSAALAGKISNSGNQSIAGNFTVVKEGDSTGNLVVQGNLTVQGTTITESHETLTVKDNIIVTNSEGAGLTNLSGLAIKINSTNAYGIVYDPTKQSVKLGIGTFDDENEFYFNPGEGASVAIRSDSEDLTNGHLLKWDATNNKIIDGGAAPTTLPNPQSLQIGGKSYNGSAAIEITIDDIGAEPAFEKKTAFNKDFGTSEGTVARGNDERIVSAGTTLSIDQSAARTALGLGTAAYTSASVPNPSGEATEQLSTIEINGVVYEVSPNMVVDLGDVGTLSPSQTFNITSEQYNRLLNGTAKLITFTSEGATICLPLLQKSTEYGGTSIYETAFISSSDIIDYTIVVSASSSNQAEFEFKQVSVPKPIVVDLGNIGELSESPTTVTITSEQCTQLLAADTSIVRFTTGDVIMNLLRMLKHGDGGGTAFYTATMVQGGYIVSHTLTVHNSSPTQAQLVTESISIGGTTVVPNPVASATSTLSKLQVDNTVYSVGTPVIDLGEVTLTEQSLGGISMATADNITVSAEQATLAQADNPPIVKIRFDNTDHEFCRTKVSSDASAAYIYFAATEDMGESTRFYNLQITVPLTGGTASALLLVWAYDILQGLNSGYEARGLTFVEGVATKTITEEEKSVFNEGGYNQIRFWDNSNTNEIYALYFSHSNRGASSINSHKCDFFSIVENASVTGEGGGLTAYAAYLDGTTLTIKQVAIGSGSGTSVPTPTTADAGKYVVVNPDGTSYILATPNAVKAQVISEAAYAQLLATGQVDANTVYLIEGTSDSKLTLTAATTSYDNATSGLEATNVQGAIDEIVQVASGLSEQISALSSQLASKQDKLTFDSTPTQDSSNPVTSGGVYAALQGKQNVLTLQALATLLGLTEAQLNNLITFSKSITSATEGSTTISGTITADTLNTAQ